jgi:hypothetical protein
MNIEDHFTEKQIKKFGKLDKDLRYYKWGMTPLIIYLCFYAILFADHAFGIASEYEIHGFQKVIKVWTASHDNKISKECVPGYKISIAEYLDRAFVNFFIATMGFIVYFRTRSNLRLTLKLWTLLNNEKAIAIKSEG